MTTPTEMKCLFMNHIETCVNRNDQDLQIDIIKKTCSMIPHDTMADGYRFKNLLVVQISVFE